MEKVSGEGIREEEHGKGFRRRDQIGGIRGEESRKRLGMGE